MKRAGGITALGLSLIALITGLSIGLKHSRNELVVKPEHKASELKPSILVKQEPWKEVENIAKKKQAAGFYIFWEIIYFQ